MSAQENNRELFETMPVAKAVRAMAIPTVVGQIIVLIYSMADTFYIGRTDNPDMVAAAALILPVFNITISIASIAAVGGGSLLSRLLGVGRNEEASRVYSFSVYFSLLLAAVFSLAALLFMRPLLLTLGADDDTFAFARSYALWVIVLGGVPTILSNVLSNFVRSIGESKKAAFGVTMGGIVNIALDPLFMFVLLPEGQEIVGAGVATCLSNCLTCLYFIAVVLRLKGRSVLELRPLRKLPERSSIQKIFAVGFPSALATFLFDVDYIVIDRLMSSYSNTALAAIGIVLKAERLPLNVGVGICQGMVPIVAYNYASRNYVRMRKVARFSLLCGIACAVFSILLNELFAPWILRFFIDDPGTVALGTDFLRVRCLATILMFASFYHVNLFNSYGRGKEALFLGVTRWAVFNIPMLFLLNRLFGMYGIVWAQFTADIFTVLLSVFVHRRFLEKNGLLAGGGK